jgi:hypothetical protein
MNLHGRWVDHTGSRNPIQHLATQHPTPATKLLSCTADTQDLPTKHTKTEIRSNCGKFAVKPNVLTNGWQSIVPCWWQIQSAGRLLLPCRRNVVMVVRNTCQGKAPRIKNTSNSTKQSLTAHYNKSKRTYMKCVLRTTLSEEAGNAEMDKVCKWSNHLACLFHYERQLRCSTFSPSVNWCDI